MFLICAVSLLHTYETRWCWLNRAYSIQLDSIFKTLNHRYSLKGLNGPCIYDIYYIYIYVCRSTMDTIHGTLWNIWLCYSAASQIEIERCTHRCINQALWILDTDIWTRYYMFDHTM